MRPTNSLEHRLCPDRELVLLYRAATETASKRVALAVPVAAVPVPPPRRARGRRPLYTREMLDAMYDEYKRDCQAKGDIISVSGLVARYTVSERTWYRYLQSLRRLP